MTASHRGIIFDDGQNLTVPQNLLPDGDFLLPVCINRDDLHRMLSVLWEGRFLIPDDPENTELGTDTHTLRHMRGVLEALAYINRPCEVPCFECDSCDDGCLEFLPNAAIIEYFPNDPFRTPEHIPPGYTRPPWYTDATFPVGGILPTDAMVDTLSVFAPALPLSGFPYARIHFSGSGEVEIELVQVPFGGIVLIDIDDDPQQITIVDCSSDVIDLVSISGILAALGFDVEDANLVGTKVIELEITTPGEHFIDVNFIPSFGGETLLGFGGGIRRVSLCGLSVPGEFMPYQLRQDPEDICSVQQSIDSGLTWTEAFRMDNCCCDDTPLYERYTDEGIKETSPDGETWTPSRETDPRFYPPTYPPLPGSPGEGLRCESANNVTGYMHSIADDWIAKAGLGSGIAYVLSILIPLLIIVVSGATGGLLTPLMLALAGALAATGGAAFDAAMTAGVYQTLVCIVYCNTPDNGIYTEANWQAIKAAIKTELTGIAVTFLHDNINAMGIAGLNNAARAGVGEGLDCDECPCDDTWCYLFEFNLDDGEWERDTSFGDNIGTHVPGQGWQHDDFLNVVQNPDTFNRGVSIKRDHAAATITKMTVIYDYTGGTYDTNTLRALFVSLNNVDRGNITRADIINGTSLVFTIEGSWGGVTKTAVFLRPSRDINSPYAGSGSATIRYVQLEGTGNNPFGADNCEP